MLWRCLNCWNDRNILGKYIVLVRVENKSKNVLTKLLLNFIAKESVVHKDCWKEYNKLYKTFKKHLIVNHNNSFFLNQLTKWYIKIIKDNCAGIKLYVQLKKWTFYLINLYLYQFLTLKNKICWLIKAAIKYLFKINMI